MGFHLFRGSHSLCLRPQTILLLLFCTLSSSSHCQAIALLVSWHSDAISFSVATSFLFLRQCFRNPNMYIHSALPFSSSSSSSSLLRNMCASFHWPTIHIGTLPAPLFYQSFPWYSIVCVQFLISFRVSHTSRGSGSHTC